MESTKQQKMWFQIDYLEYFNQSLINQTWLEIDLEWWTLIKSKVLSLMQVRIWLLNFKPDDLINLSKKTSKHQ